MGKDYYKILGVDKSADDEAIKRAYKKKALLHHPDRNQGSTDAADKFKEVSEAFEVLSDKNKRAVYDQFGEEGLKGGGPSPGAGPSGFGGGFPGGGASFSGFPGGQTFSFSSSGPGANFSGFRPSDPNDIFASFFSAMGGGMGGGMGGFPGGSFTSAGRRGGAGGARSRGASMFAGFDDMDDSDDYGGGMPGGMPGAQTRRPRPAAPDDDKSAGDVIKPLKVSLEDLYTGTTKHLKIGRRLASGGQEDKILDVPIHAGYKSGTKIRFPRSGNEQPDGSAQDIVFVVEEKPHDVFTRDGNDLITSQKIPLLEALTGSGGAARTITHLNGSKLQVKLPAAIVKPGHETRVLGKGMPIRKGGATGSFGDLIVKWEIEFPERLTASQQDGLKKVLG